MVPVAQMYLKDAAQTPPEQILLMELVRDMTKHDVSRLPILDNRRPLSLVHKATINEFMVQSIETRNVEELTLQDLLTEHPALNDSYAEVSIDATIEEAKSAMGAKPGCQDVYIMQDGLVVGWLPNVMFIQN
jgi:predicted transcriptional regulator